MSHPSNSSTNLLPSHTEEEEKLLVILWTSLSVSWASPSSSSASSAGFPFLCLKSRCLDTALFANLVGSLMHTSAKKCKMVNGQQHATTTQSPTQSPAAAPAAVFLLLLLLPMGILALIFPPLPNWLSWLLTYSPNMFQIPAKANNCRFRTCCSLLCHHSLQNQEEEEEDMQNVSDWTKTLTLTWWCKQVLLEFLRKNS